MTIDPSSEVSQDNGAAIDDFDELEIDLEVLKVFDGLDGLPTAIKDRVSREKQRISRKKDALIHHSKTAPFIKLRDKIAFTLGVFNVAMTTFILGIKPEYFYLWHTPKSISLCIIRYIIYHRSKYHYFMVDFCYFTNLLCLIYIWFGHNSPYLFQVMYAFSMGPLLWAIIAWRNSLVFHSLDKITSVFIHISPALTLWGVRWYGHERLPETFTIDPNAGFWELVIGVLPFYFLWQALYALKVWVLDKEKVQSRNYVTSFSYLMEDEKHPMYKFVNSFNNVPPKLMFVIAQFIYTLFTLLPVYVFYHSFWANTGFICLMFLGCSWNGANFYVEVFSRRYQQQLESAKRVRRLTHDIANSPKPPTAKKDE